LKLIYVTASKVVFFYQLRGDLMNLVLILFLTLLFPALLMFSFVFTQAKMPGFPEKKTFFTEPCSVFRLRAKKAIFSATDLVHCGLLDLGQFQGGYKDIIEALAVKLAETEAELLRNLDRLGGPAEHTVENMHNLIEGHREKCLFFVALLRKMLNAENRESFLERFLFFYEEVNIYAGYVENMSAYYKSAGLYDMKMTETVV
jgi:hypothetical protein